MDKTNWRKRPQEPAENTDDDMVTASPPHKKKVVEHVDLTKDTDSETRYVHLTILASDLAISSISLTQ